MASYLAVFLIIVIETELNSFFNAISLILRKVKSKLRHAGSPKVIKSAGVQKRSLAGTNKHSENSGKSHSQNLWEQKLLQQD